MISEQSQITDKIDFLVIEEARNLSSRTHCTLHKALSTTTVQGCCVDRLANRPMIRPLCLILVSPFPCCCLHHPGRALQRVRRLHRWFIFSSYMTGCPQAHLGTSRALLGVQSADRVRDDSRILSPENSEDLHSLLPLHCHLEVLAGPSAIAAFSFPCDGSIHRLRSWCDTDADPIMTWCVRLLLLGVLGQY